MNSGRPEATMREGGDTGEQDVHRPSGDHEFRPERPTFAAAPFAAAREAVGLFLQAT